MNLFVYYLFLKQYCVANVFAAYTYCLSAVGHDFQFHLEIIIIIAIIMHNDGDGRLESQQSRKLIKASNILVLCLRQIMFCQTL